MISNGVALLTPEVDANNQDVMTVKRGKEDSKTY